MQLFGISAWDSVEFAVFDFQGKCHWILSLEWRSERAEFVDDTAERPYIAQIIVFLIMNLLWAHVIGRSHMRECKLTFVIHDPRQSEVSKLAVAVRVEEDVAGFQIPVQYLLWQTLRCFCAFLRIFIRSGR